MQRLKKNSLKLLGSVLGDREGRFLARFLSRKVLSQLRGSVTNEIMLLLLEAMDVYACLCKDYRKNLDRWQGDLVFTTLDGAVKATARMNSGDMQVIRDTVPNPAVLVEFKDAAALRRFFFSKDQDILDSILHNEVQVSGNYNHVYRFGFLARDLELRLLGDAA